MYNWINKNYCFISKHNSDTVFMDKDEFISYMESITITHYTHSEMLQQPYKNTKK